MTIYCSVRLERLKDDRSLRAATDHANREDATSKLRARPEAKRAGVRHHPWAPLGDETRIDYVRDLEVMRARKQVEKGYGAAPVAHMLCSVSSEWIIQAGELHDEGNPRNQQFFAASIAWAETVFGETSILAARMDLDEGGGGVVDVLVAPVAIGKRGKPYLSCSPALEALRGKHERRKTFEALQDSFAAYLQANLDPIIERGKPKEGRGPDRLTPEIYGAKKDIARDRAELARQREELDRQRAALEAERLQEAQARQSLLEYELFLKSKWQELLDRQNQFAARQRLLATAPVAFRQVLHAFLDERIAIDEDTDVVIANEADETLLRSVDLVNALGLQRVFVELRHSLEILSCHVDDLRERFDGGIILP